LERTVILLLILLPVLAGIALAAARLRSRRLKKWLIAAVLLLETAGAAWLCRRPVEPFIIWHITDVLSISFMADSLSGLFSVFTACGWLLAGVFAFSYMRHEEREDEFFCFFLMVEGLLLGMDFAADLVTMYLFYELITLCSLPLVLHSRRKEAVAAAVKYFMYSAFGALLLLFGIVTFSHWVPGLGFSAGGALDPAHVTEQGRLLLTAVFLMVVGCGAKAGLFPLHGWLPDAHPAAPAPASAVLSALIAKAGVFAILRVLFYTVGPELLTGSWVQTALLSLAVLTVLMGSAMACFEKDLKRRLAYSTIGQISYILCGLFLLTPQGVAGGLLHFCFHAGAKLLLFLAAGSLILRTGSRQVDALQGIGRQMPLTMGSFSVGALALVGLPPLFGFVSKWSLASAALGSGPPVFTFLVPAALLASALLTAAYLLPLVIGAFFPGRGFVSQLPEGDGDPLRVVPLIVQAVLTSVLGLLPGGLLIWTEGAALAMF
jgi:multicomponent Na+:H+ antiporter subunit D